MLPVLHLLNKAWEDRALILAAAVIGLALLATRQQESIAALKEQLAAKPMIEERIVEKVVTRVERGPVRVEIKTIEKPGGERIVEKVVFRDRVVIDTGKESIDERSENPICPSAPQVKTWAVGGDFDMRRRDRGGIGIYKSLGNLSLGVSHDVGAQSRLGDVSLRGSIKIF